MFASFDRDQLDDIQLFHGCSRRELALIDSVLAAVVVPANTVVCSQGGRGSQAVVFVSGEAEVSIDGEAIATVGAGTIVGEVAIIDNGWRNATVTTTTECEMLVVEAVDLRILLNHIPMLRDRVLTLAEARR
jgi:CRP/FNR family transcriptional regulator, cyclic AMP receptor protein